MESPSLKIDMINRLFCSINTEYFVLVLKIPESYFLIRALILYYPRGRCKKFFKSVTLSAFFSPIYYNLHPSFYFTNTPGKTFL